MTSDRARRQRLYFALMGTCVALIALAWNVVRLWSVGAAVAMSVVAALLAPIAVVVANWGAERRLRDDPRFDSLRPGDPGEGDGGVSGRGRGPRP